jgi:xylulokinase
MTRSALVGIDIGTTAAKGVAVDPESGEVLAVASRSYPVSRPQPGWVEQDPEAWVSAAHTVLKQLRSEVSQVIGLSFSGQMHGLVCLDAHGDVIRPAILWNDQRSAAECASIEARLGVDGLVGLTGNRALAGFTAPKLLWLRGHEADNYQRIRRISLPKDHVRDSLTGGHRIDVADASGTLLLDVAKRRWSSEMVDELELDERWLPEVVESPERVARTDGMAVAAGAGDQAAAAVGVGVTGPGPVSLVLGTSGVVLAALDRYVADPQGRVHAFCHALPSCWQVMGVMLSAAGSLAWYRDTLFPDISYDVLLQEAQRSDPGCDGLIFLPYLAGERTPHADPDARGCFCGLTLRHSRSGLTRSVLEGVAFGIADCFDAVRATGVPTVRARVSGGGSRSQLWLRIVASVVDLPLEVVASEQGSAFGAALLAGVAAGVFGSVEEAADACVRVTETVTPVKEWIEPYRETRQRFRALYPALRQLQSPQSRSDEGLSNRHSLAW